MAIKTVLGLFQDANQAADAGDALKESGVSENDVDFLTDCPYPEGAFGEREEPIRLFLFPFIGGLIGFVGGLMITSMTQMAYPLITGGKPILSLPPMAVVMYEGTMLGAILFTVIGVIFESRLPHKMTEAYDERVSQGYIGVLVTSNDDNSQQVNDILSNAGAVDTKIA
ncbi:MAG TPA: hypothetical protein DEZ08_03875 [Dehalococcoidia bacterium]|jgi:hypothetical protein|nr:hypothetical protein [Dehalococcoidia bacterium]|tara:strand:- start:1962 stop:2468 length:507 start_codon:yes stop_codon:yes gene_type:complete